MTERANEMSETNESPDPGFLADLKDAVSLRTVMLVVGVLLVQLAFVASYVGAFHHPTPHDVPVGVVAPPQQAAQLTQKLDAAAGHPLSPEVVPDRATAVRRITSTDLSGALIVDPASTTDELLVASGGGASLATALEQLATQVGAQQGRSVKVTDIVPLQSGDARGLSGFYLVIGWLVGGYLVASLLGVAKGSRPATPRRATIRLGATVPYALASGLGGALIVDQWLGAQTGHFWALWGLGTLLVLSSATVTMAFQVLFGTIGIGLTVLLFVVLGNPSAGGAYQSHLLPSLWRTVGGWIPNGAGTDAVRRIVYFDAHGVGSRLAVIVAYIVVGVVVTLGASVLRARAGLGRRAHAG
ncbi:ABC transporter permease [Nocardioides nematodiphilus]|uniref:ABC transporter permease n=1 Tax=Nocardioides nematodiphilus TaxID=2849669 RepID=UPI001CD9D0A6|nr:ABC transporter permease [Nocardioides nematodiphilus]MCA1983572.1 DUF3533 domain-containing protein [Nocardioides nematodiphilus]